MNTPLIRPATLEDISALTRIYNHAILHGTGTFELEAISEDEMLQRYQKLISNGYPYLVACEGSTVLGYAYAGPMHPRAAYAKSVESTIYLAPDAQGKGLGKALLASLLDEVTKRGFFQIVALIGDSENHGSIGVHKALGFEKVGQFSKVGIKFGRELDVVLMQKSLKA